MWFNIFSITSALSITAIIFIVAPHDGQTSGSTSHTFFIPLLLIARRVRHDRHVFLYYRHSCFCPQAAALVRVISVKIYIFLMPLRYVCSDSGDEISRVECFKILFGRLIELTHINLIKGFRAEPAELAEEWKIFKLFSAGSASSA
ncbi:MAG: hypothetical protein A2096_17585 [Spirochaetes bacterium GWF1_41_5]|nr:MAG: hypothetical protein A2096_17585 [Spirochaetes bacterium GWF1_41_5]